MATAPAEGASPWYIGHHDADRALPVSYDALRDAHDWGYDMLTTPITTPHFHTSVLHILTTYHQAHPDGSSSSPLPVVPALQPLDTPLTPGDSVSQLVAFTSPWIDLASPDPLIAHLSRQVFNLEIAYASFCGVVTVVIPGPKLAHGPDGLSQYARAIKEALALGGFLQLHILLPMKGGRDADVEDEPASLARFSRLPMDDEALLDQAEDSFAAWHAWNVIRSVCQYYARLSVALDLPRRLPVLALQERWYSEPVRLLYLRSASFLVNAKGSFVLSRAHQLFLFRCMRLRSAPWILLAEVGATPGANSTNEPFAFASVRSPDTAEAPSPVSPTPADSLQLAKQAGRKARSDPCPHLSYLRYLQKNQPPRSAIERFSSGFQDYLQSPLQPLADDLESITYEVFEKDPVKYDWYERAIALALKDWGTLNRSTSSASGAVVLAVVGAGRGPLVTRVLKASEDMGVPVEVYAIEKNANAYVLLQRHNEEYWQRRVTVVKTDMRAWRGPKLADGSHGHVDILVSELLGSFADNELSPECLDGAQHVLNPHDGISIPVSYSAQLTPIASPRLHADLISRSHNGDRDAFETPWVVMLHQFDYLSTQEPHGRANSTANGAAGANQKKGDDVIFPNVQHVWTFSHPAPHEVLQQSASRRGGSAEGGGGGPTGGDGANEHNTRFTKLSFAVKEGGVCHGLAGYFETMLYEGRYDAVELSTNPVTMEQKSKDMISWFPIFFPLKTPLAMPESSEAHVSMWRQTDDRKVWYEWLVEVFLVMNGRRVRLGMSDLHSSKSNGCLM